MTTDSTDFITKATPAKSILLRFSRSYHVACGHAVNLTYLCTCTSCNFKMNKLSQHEMVFQKDARHCIPWDYSTVWIRKKLVSSSINSWGFFQLVPHDLPALMKRLDNTNGIEHMEKSLTGYIPTVTVCKMSTFTTQAPNATSAQYLYQHQLKCHTWRKLSKFIGTTLSSVDPGTGFVLLLLPDILLMDQLFSPQQQGS